MGTASMDVRGELVMILRKFIDANLDEQQRAVVYEGLPPQVTSLLPKLKPTEYYPLECATSLMNRVDLVVGDPQKSFDLLVNFGMFLATDAMNTFMKLLFKILTPSLLTTKFPTAYKRYYKNGILTADVANIGEKMVSFTAEGHDWLHAEATGWILFIYGEIGMKNIRVKTNVPLGQANVPGDIRWDVSWD